MVLYVRIVDGALEQVGALPESSVRLDTLTPVNDLGGAGAIWQRACGWYQVDTLDLGALDLSDEQRQTIAETLDEAMARRSRRDTLHEKADQLTPAIRGFAWDWLDHNCHPTALDQIAFVREQSPNAGSIPPAWATLTAAQKADVLDLSMSYVLAALIRFSQAFDLVFDVLDDMIDTTDVDAAVTNGGGST